MKTKKKLRRIISATLTVCIIGTMLAQGFIAHGFTAYAAEDVDTGIKATITVASNKSKQEMQSYLDAFNKKYPEIEIDYNYYSDYETEVGKQIESGDYPDVLFVPGSVGADKYAAYFEPLGSRDELKKKYQYLEGSIACMAIGSWALKQVQDAGSNGDNVAYMPFPNEVDGKQYMAIVDDYCYAINKNSENKEAARAYIDFMLDESGYALNQEVLSVVKTDPILDSYGDMNNVICLCDNEASDNNYQKRQTLSTNLNILDSTDEIKRVIEAAEGKRNETFDEIAEDWNERWESSRTDDMMPDGSAQKTVLGSALSQNYDVEFSDIEQEYIDRQDRCTHGTVQQISYKRLHETTVREE